MKPKTTVMMSRCGKYELILVIFPLDTMKDDKNHFILSLSPTYLLLVLYSPPVPSQNQKPSSFNLFFRPLHGTYSHILVALLCRPQTVPANEMKASSDTV
mmetsp:Transcript_46557/g.47280  ORF Transcript_46557/g.47280 Transcript_46557/m.47280 type:complete len:100 (-) Transcript_46557:280-579(-)